MNSENPPITPEPSPLETNRGVATMSDVVEKVYAYLRVEFKGNRRLYVINPLELAFRVGGYAVVQVEKGEDLGKVVGLLDRLPERFTLPTLGVLRLATPKDLSAMQELREREKAARLVCQEKIIKHGLQMKLVDVEYQFDGRKLTFYFTADGRVDFRQLVKDLAASFRTRIELRQIGARDETRRFNGLGPCGRPLCCVGFISEFCPITTQMAKDQNLPLNPGKISGCCGRLKCCLGFEIETYREIFKTLPRWETHLETTKGPAVVEKLDIFTCTVYLKFASGEVEKFDAAQLAQILPAGFKLFEEAIASSEEDVLDSGLVASSDDFDYPHNPS